MVCTITFFKYIKSSIPVAISTSLTIATGSWSPKSLTIDILLQFNINYLGYVGLMAVTLLEKSKFSGIVVDLKLSPTWFW